MGPTDDGRIKPDIAFQGNNIYTTTGPKNNDYDLVSGTSVAAAKTSGFLLLLQDYFNKKKNHYMKAATLKGLALHTTVNVGFKGPDYMMGWGIFNPLTAISAIKTLGHKSLIAEKELYRGEIYTLEVNAEKYKDLVVSLSWTDPPFKGDIPRNKANISTPTLVNDLNLKVIQGENSYYPYLLNPRKPNLPAKTGINNVDNFEKIEIPNAKGVYTIQISHSGVFLNEHQNFSLIVTGLQISDCELEAPKTFSIKSTSNSSINIVWNEKGQDATYKVQYKTKNTANWSMFETKDPSFELKGLLKDTSYEFKVKSICSEFASSDYSTKYEFMFNLSETKLFESNYLKEIFPDSPILTTTTSSIQIHPLVPKSSSYFIFNTSGQLLKQGILQNHEILFDSNSSGFYILLLKKDNIKKSSLFFKN